MPVSTWKRLLSLLNLAAVLGLAGTGYAFFQHRDYLAQPFQKPSFQIRRGPNEPPGETGAIAIPLGRPFEPVKRAEGSGDTKAEKKEVMLTALQRLGKIIDAVALEPPYTFIYPTITFQFTADQKTEVILRLGEALVNKKKGPLDVPHQYQFIGCNSDRADSDVLYFWFKMRVGGDGEPQWLKWRAEAKSPREYVSADDTRDFQTSIKGNNGVFRADADLATIRADLPDNPQAAEGGESTGGATKKTDAGGEAKGDAATDPEKGDADPKGAETKITAVEEPVPADQPKLFDIGSRSGRFEPTEEGVAQLVKVPKVPSPARFVGPLAVASTFRSHPRHPPTRSRSASYDDSRGGRFCLVARSEVRVMRILIRFFSLCAAGGRFWALC